MAIITSLHIGINDFDFGHYKYSSILNKCDDDARAMANLTKSVTATSPTVITDNKSITTDRILNLLKAYAKKLNSGDMLIITYSGHGGTVPNKNKSNEDKKYDQTWCLYDRMLVDDELARAWTMFKEGVKVLVISDSCHSGSIVAFIKLESHLDIGSYDNSTMANYDNKIIKSKKALMHKSKLLPIESNQFAYNNNKKMYDEIQNNIDKNIKNKIKASILLLSACRDDQEAVELGSFGVFTGILLEVHNKGGFKNYKEFHEKIKAKSPNTQTPQLQILGSNKQNNIDFLNNFPFRL